MLTRATRLPTPFMAGRLCPEIQLLLGSIQNSSDSNYSSIDADLPYPAASRAFTSSITSSCVVSPCVTHARMISRPSNVAAATQTRPAERIFSTIDRGSPNRGGGWMHNTATGESLRIVHPRHEKLLLEQFCQLNRAFHMFRVAVPSGHRERQKQA